MKAVESLTLAVAAAVSFPAAADIVKLDFDGVTQNAKIQNFYNGGMDSSGKSGTTDGAVFSDNAFAIQPSNAGNLPSGSQVMTLGGNAGSVASATLGFAAGLESFSFYFSSYADITIDALDAGGKSVIGGAVDISANDVLGSTSCKDSSGASVGPFCNWTQVAPSLSGTAYSLVFGGSGGSIALFDSVVLTTVGAPPSLPEPGSMALVGLALSALAFAGRRRQPA